MTPWQTIVQISQEDFAIRALFAFYLFEICLVVYYGMKLFLWFLNWIDPQPEPPKFTWGGWIATTLALGAGAVLRYYLAK